MITGTALGEGELVQLVGGVAEGNSVRWRRNITKPLKMRFSMQLEIDGDTWSGTAKAKIFPAAK